MGAQDPPERVVQRVLSKVAMGPRGCHISTYSVASHGYAQIGWREGDERPVTLCHRVMWIWFRGPIPEGMTIDHMCKNKRCIRLQHLRLIPNYENSRRGNARDWPLGKCAKGHDDAAHWRPGGVGQPRLKGYCAVCLDASRKSYEARHPDRVAASRARSAVKARSRRAAA